MKRLRLGVGVIVAALLVLTCAPARLLAKLAGSRFGRSAPVVFNRWLCFVLRVRIRLIGAPSAATRRLIVGNHVSWLDIPVLGAIEPMTFLAKQDIGDTWLGRPLGAVQGIIFVDRARKRCIPAVNRQMTRAMSAGEPVALFPEATTNDGNRMYRFRSSHFEPIRALGPGAVVQPVYFHYSRLAGMPVARADRPIFAWYGAMTFSPSFWRVFHAGALTCDLYYGEPLPATPDVDRKALARAAERAVRALAERARGIDASRGAEKALE